MGLGLDMKVEVVEVEMEEEVVVVVVEVAVKEVVVMEEGWDIGLDLDTEVGAKMEVVEVVEVKVMIRTTKMELVMVQGMIAVEDDFST